jgi:hypothetical protein
MPTSTSYSALRFAASVLLVVLVGGCAGQTDEQDSAAPATTTTTVAPPTTTVTPLTDEEIVWLDAIPAVATKVDKSMAAITELTPSGMARLGTVLRGCNRDLVRGGSPSDRVQPVFVLVTKACKAYDKGAACFAKAASIGIPFAGTKAERDQSKALDCGFAAPGAGALLLAEAESMATEIREQAG